MATTTYIVVPYRRRGKGRPSIATLQLRSEGKSKKLIGYKFIEVSNDNQAQLPPKLSNLGISYICITRSLKVYDPVTKGAIVFIFAQCKYKASFNSDLSWIDTRLLQSKVVGYSKAILSKVSKALDSIMTE